MPCIASNESKATYVLAENKIVSLKGYLPEITQSLRLLMRLGRKPPNLASPRKHNLMDHATGYSCFPHPAPDARETWSLSGIRRIFPTLSRRIGYVFE